MNALIEKLKKVKSQKLGKMPVVILPLEDFEKMKEDIEIYQSKKLSAEIAKAKEEVCAGKVLSFDEVKKKLKLA